MTDYINPGIPTVLTIAGSDPSGGAGIQADLKTIHALGGYALTVCTVLTAQNTQGVVDAMILPAKLVRQQLEVLQDDIQIDAIKIGMLGCTEIIHEVASFLQTQPDTPVVFDPVIRSSSGRELLPQDALAALQTELLPKVDLFTPNLPELNRLLSTDFTQLSPEMSRIQAQLQQHLWPPCLIKGGHSSEDEAIDFLVSATSKTATTFDSPRLQVQHNHGTGCTLSSAIAVGLAKKQPLQEAIGQAKAYLIEALKTSDQAQPHYLSLAEGHARHGSLNHFFK